MVPTYVLPFAASAGKVPSNDKVLHELSTEAVIAVIFASPDEVKIRAVVEHVADLWLSLMAIIDTSWSIMSPPTAFSIVTSSTDKVIASTKSIDKANVAFVLKLLVAFALRAEKK